MIIVALTLAWAPTFAWLAAIIASSATALAIVGVDWEARRLVDVGRRPWLGLVVIAGLLMPVTIAAAYAAAGRVGRAVAVIAGVVVIVLTVGLLSRYLERAFGGADLDGVLPEWLWLAVVALLAAIGLVRDLRPALARTRVRLAAGDAGPARAGAALPALRVFVDELVPGRDAGRDEAVETERGRLAADLHAEVLPSLRRALAQAEAGGTVERLGDRPAVGRGRGRVDAARSPVDRARGDGAARRGRVARGARRGPVRRAGRDRGGRSDPAAAAPGSAPRRPPAARGRAGRVPGRAARARQRGAARAGEHGAGLGRRRPAPDPAARSRTTRDWAPIDEAAATRSGRRGIADMRAEAAACAARSRSGAARTTGARRSSSAGRPDAARAAPPAASTRAHERRRRMGDIEALRGIWNIVPTPFLPDGALDIASIPTLVSSSARRASTADDPRRPRRGRRGSATTSGPRCSRRPSTPPRARSPSASASPMPRPTGPSRSPARPRPPAPTR